MYGALEKNNGEKRMKSKVKLFGCAVMAMGLAVVAAPVTTVVKSADPANPYQTYTCDTAV